jgi:carboxylate-amine ligase
VTTREQTATGPVPAPTAVEPIDRVPQTGRVGKRTFGVEEELLLVSADSGHPVPAGAEVLEAAQEWLGTDRDHLVDHEFKMEQTEIGSEPCTEPGQLLEQLMELRRTVSAAAGTTGVHAVALATSPFKVWPQPTVNERYQRMTEAFGIVARQQLTCGQHIHVAIDSQDEGVAVLDRIRRWLPVITAMSVNSPFYQGQDTGYSSYRTIAWGMWPTAGPTARFGDVATYQRTIDELVTSGTALDDGMIYFDARLSASYPTLEIRVPDVCTDVGDSVLIAVLARALVDTAAGEWADGLPDPEIRVEMLRAAGWRASRSGLSGDLVDPVVGTPAPAWSLVEDMIRHVEPALRANGELDWVESAVRKLRTSGTGADQQRASFARRGLLADVVLDAAQRTVI